MGQRAYELSAPINAGHPVPASPTMPESDPELEPELETELELEPEVEPLDAPAPLDVPLEPAEPPDPPAHPLPPREPLPEDPPAAFPLDEPWLASMSLGRPGLVGDDEPHALIKEAASRPCPQELLKNISPQSAQGQRNWLSILRPRLPKAREERIDRKIRRSASLLIF
jgi:hypothetical protein